MNGQLCRFCSNEAEEKIELLFPPIHVCNECHKKLFTHKLFKCLNCGHVWLKEGGSGINLLHFCDVCIHTKEGKSIASILSAG